MVAFRTVVRSGHCSTCAAGSIPRDRSWPGFRRATPWPQGEPRHCCKLLTLFQEEAWPALKRKARRKGYGKWLNPHMGSAGEWAQTLPWYASHRM